jgi:hypothetical protein
MSLFMVAGICVSKVFSPQFLVWLFPLISLLPARQGLGKKGIGLFGVIYVLTVLVSYHYYRPLIRLRPAGIVILGLRNGVFLAFGIYLWSKLTSAPLLRNRESVAGSGQQDAD